METLAVTPKLMWASRVAQLIAPILLAALLAVAGWGAVQFNNVQIAMAGIASDLRSVVKLEAYDRDRIDRLEARLSGKGN